MNDDEMNQIPQADARAKQQVTATAFAAKYKSKREVFNFLTMDVKAYLPTYDTVSIYFLKDLVSGKKKSKSLYLFSLMFFYL